MYVALFDMRWPLVAAPEPDPLGEQVTGVPGRWKRGTLLALGIEMPTELNYSRKAVTFGAPGGDGFASNTNLVTLGGPQASPAAWALPASQENFWYFQVVAICTGGVRGVADVLAFELATIVGRVNGTDRRGIANTIDRRVEPGESLSFPVGSLRYKSSPATLQPPSATLT